MRYMRKLHPYLDILVSNIGEVYRPQSGTHKAKWTFGSKKSDGYRQVQINGKRYKVHRLVAQTFIGEVPDGMEIDHVNRVRDDNRVDNLRIVSRSENNRNTSSHDRVEEQGRTHFYEDEEQYNRERGAHYRREKCKTHRRVQFSDGSRHYCPLPEADAYLIIPLKERHYHGK